MIQMMYPSGSALKSPIELLILLTIEKEKEIHGFELIKRLDKFDKWEPKAGTIYPILDRLTKRNLLEKIDTSDENTRKKAVFRLTENGLEVLKGSIDILEMSMDFFEKIFEIGNEVFDNNIKIIDFMRNRFEIYFNLIQKKKFDSNPDTILKLSQFTDFLNEEIKNLEKRITDLKKEGEFVKVDIK